jgi:hypothetical protein
MNIELSGLKKHFFTPKNPKTPETHKKNKVKTKIVQECFFSIHEVHICNTIKKIPFYTNYYNILEDVDRIHISTLQEKGIQKVHFIDENTKYLLFTYKNNPSATFDEFLSTISNPKLLIFHVIETFSHLLQSLHQLNEQNIVFFQLSHENIVFTREKPFLQNFRLSLQVSKLQHPEYITNIIKISN